MGGGDLDGAFDLGGDRFGGLDQHVLLHEIVVGVRRGLVNAALPPHLGFGLDREVDHRGAVVERVPEAVRGVEVARSGDHDGRSGRTGSLGVAPGLVGDGGLVTGADEPEVVPSVDHLVERERLGPRDAEERIDATREQPVDEYLADGHVRTFCGTGVKRIHHPAREPSSPSTAFSTPEEGRHPVVSGPVARRRYRPLTTRSRWSLPEVLD